MWTALGILWGFIGVAYLLTFEAPIKVWLGNLGTVKPSTMAWKVFLFTFFLGPLIWAWLIIAGLAELGAWWKRRTKRDDNDTLFI